MNIPEALKRPGGRLYLLAAFLLAIVVTLMIASGASALAVGEIVSLTGKFRVMKDDLKTGVGMQSAGASGKIVSGPKTVGKKQWWYVDFDNGTDGWVSSSVLTSGGAPGLAAPLVDFSASPSSIATGEVATLKWSASNVDSCTGSGNGFSGVQPEAGSMQVRPVATSSYKLTCTGNGGSVARTATVTVAAPSAVSVSLQATPSAIAAGGSSLLAWTSSNATSCTASGGAGFSGGVATSGNVSVRPSVATDYSISCTGPSGSASDSVTVSVSSGTNGPASAFADPDDGNIPDRALHPIAFPTAVGFGRVTKVRSPDAVVYKINSLEDVADPNDGKITYRECAMALAVNSPYAIPAGRPRYCVFDVSGAIEMNSSAPITQPHIYIAGQTSPGGIEFRLGKNFDPVDSLIYSRRGGDHMIVRHVRTRLGEHVGRKSLNGDPIRISATRYQILDHVSTMFGTDESLDMVCEDCTVQWSIIGPNICRNAGHSSSLHCKTFFVKPASNITIAYNLTQHGEHRGINIAGGTAPVKAGNAAQLDIVNNVMYHFTQEQGLVSNQFGDVYANYINNVSFRGPRYSNSDENFFVGLYSTAGFGNFGFNIHAKGNVTPHTRVAGQFGQSVSDAFHDMVGMLSKVTADMVCGLSGGQRNCGVKGKDVVQAAAVAVAPGNSGLSMLSKQIVPAEQAMSAVLSQAGADMCRDGQCRDNVDKLYIEDVSTCDMAPYLFEKDWTSTVAASGGWAQLTPGSAKKDSDNDGMPDEWEAQFKNTNPNVWDANADADGDGYPNIEEYLNAMARDHIRYDSALKAKSARVPAYNCGRPQFKPQV